jgi:hypothetical protein
VEEIFQIYQWARVRNIYPLSCPTTVSGKGIDEAERTSQAGSYLEKLMELYASINLWNVEHGLDSIEGLRVRGISLYPGCHVCNQVAAGLYLNLSGQVVQCPGRVDQETLFCPDIRKEPSLTAVWRNSPNYRRASGEQPGADGDYFNYRCPSRDGHNLPHGFYNEILRQIEARHRRNPAPA